MPFPLLQQVHFDDRLPVALLKWWRRRVLPPGPNGLLRRPFITIAGKPAGANIGGNERGRKSVGRFYQTTLLLFLDSWRGGPADLAGEDPSGHFNAQGGHSGPEHQRLRQHSRHGGPWGRSRPIRLQGWHTRLAFAIRVPGLRSSRSGFTIYDPPVSQGSRSRFALKTCVEDSCPELRF